MKKFSLKIWTFFLSLILTSTAFGETLVLNDSETSIHLGENLEYIVDVNKNLTFEKISSSEFSSNWTKNTGKTFSYSQPGASIWFRFFVDFSASSDSWIFKLHFPRLDFLRFFSPTDEGKYSSIPLNMYTPFDKRPIFSPNYVVPLSETKKPFYFLIESDAQINVNPVILSAGEFEKVHDSTNFGFGLYFGVMLVMFCYNFILFISLKDRSYLYYTLYTAFFALLLGSIEGLTNQYLWFGLSPEIDHRMYQILGCGTFYFFILFARTYLPIETFPKRYKVLLKLAFVPVFLQLVIGIIEPRGIADVTAILMASSVMAAVTVTAVFNLKRARESVYFFAATSFVIAGSLAFIAQMSGLVPQNFFTEYGPMVGSGFEVTILSLGLADRINKMSSALSNQRAQLELTNKSLQAEIEERKKAHAIIEQQKEIFVQTERLRVIGEISASISHEIRNAVTGLQVRMMQLKRLFLFETLDRVSIDSSLQKLEQSSDRVIKIVQSITTLSRNSVNDALSEVDVKSIIEDTGDLFREKVKMAGIKFETTIPDGSILLSVRPTQISQVLLNLLSNAVDATVKIDNSWISLDMIVGEDYVDLRVQNSGNKIPAEIRENLFSPFYTTKASGKGTGLGLTTSKTIIEQHGGVLFLDDEQEFTTFVVRLPKPNSKKNFA